jgi:hypothetical protein
VLAWAAADALVLHGVGPIWGGAIMTGEKWLWDQPKSWHAMNRALHDIAVLLNYLNELPDSRLLSYFKATQDRVSEDRAQNTVPPCDSYAEFLDRLDAIAAAFQTGRPPPDPAPGGDGQPTLGAVAFVNWSRDFLAAVRRRRSGHREFDLRDAAIRDPPIKQAAGLAWQARCQSLQHSRPAAERHRVAAPFAA